MSYLLINKMMAQPGKRDELLTIMLESGKLFDANEHCLVYLVSKDIEDDNALWVQDMWTDETSHQAAMGSEAMQAYVKQAMPLLQGMPEQHQIESAGGKLPFKL